MSTKKGPKSQSPSYHHGDLKAALLESALELLDTHGMDQLSLRKVATHAGVSHGAPYRHFEDKEGLLAAVAQQGFVAMYEQMSAARDTAPQEDPNAQLNALGKAYVLFALNHPTHFRLMFGPHMGHTARHQETRNAGERCYGILLDIVARGQQAGVLPEGPSAQVALGYWSIVQGLSTLLINGMVRDKVLHGDASTQDMEMLIERTLQTFGARHM